VEKKCRGALAGGGCQPGRKHVQGTTRRRSGAWKVTSGSRSALTSPKATTTSRTIHRFRSANPPEGGAPSEDTKETTPPEQYTRQTLVHRKNLVRDRIMCGRCKDSTGHRMGKRANIDFCLGGITNEISTPETKSPSHVVQPRCSFFPYADAATSRRT